MEKIMSAIGIAFFVLFAGVLLAIMPVPMGLMMAALLVILIFVMGRVFVQANRAESLIARDTEPGFVIDAEGISGSIVMLEGKKRDRMVAEGEARFTLKWDEINEIEFRPGTGSSSTSRGAPPYLVIFPNNEFDPLYYYYVQRDAFVGKEEAMVDAIRARNIRLRIDGKLK